MITSTLESKRNAAYVHGRLDCKAGAPYDPKTPLQVYRNLGKEEQVLIAASWADGWMDESLTQSEQYKWL